MIAHVPPIIVVLVRCTALLALAWSAHLLLRTRHARWRQMLWRGILLSVVVIGLMPAIGLPLFEVTLPLAAPVPGAMPEMPLAAPVLPALPNAPAVPAAALSRVPDAASSPLPAAAPAQPFRFPLTLGEALLLVWAVGAGSILARLAYLYARLHRLRVRSVAAEGCLQTILAGIQADLRMPRAVEVRVSSGVGTPFLCGLRRPAILLPAALAAELSPHEAAALLAHEVAHVKRGDLFWCIAWRGMLAILWFHPLAWKIPAAHELACEQEADRLAAETSHNREGYAQFLARLALRLLALPSAESRLALSASAQITRRLVTLKSPPASDWTRVKTFAASAFVAAALALTAGCEVGMRKPVDVNAPIDFRKTLVVVHDDAGKPIEDAIVTPNGFRVKGIHSADAYGWNMKLFGKAVPATTDADGKAWVLYPVMAIPQEQEYTGAITFDVERAGFCRANEQDHYVDQPDEAVVMHRSATLDVTAYLGADHTPVTDLVANLSTGRPTDWEKRADGHFVNTKAQPGQHVLQLMGRLESGQIVFSEGVVVTGESEKTTTLALVMKPGIRVEGRIDPGIPRPLANGHVFISIRPAQFPVKPIVQDYYAPQSTYGYMTFWHTYRPINSDGTFVFEAVPPGEADITAVGDGFVSTSQGEFRNRMPDGSIEKQDAGDGGFVIPQAFPLIAPTTAITVAAAASATLEFTVKTRGGKPVENADLFLNPNNIRMSGSGIFGTMRTSSESPFRAIDPLPIISYTARTDKNGKATIRNIPGTHTSAILEHPDYQVEVQQPNGWRDRNVRLDFPAGQATNINVTVESKGFSFIGMR